MGFPPDDLKTVFDDNSDADWLRTVGKVWRDSDDKAIAMAVASGNERITLTEAEMGAFNEALSPVVEAWIEEHAGADFDARSLVEAARAAIAANSAQ